MSTIEAAAGFPESYWDDLAHDLADPEFLREYVVESMRIATIDDVVNAIDEARVAAGLSKAELARAIQKEPATIRRLLSSDHSNPTLGTLAEVATALGLRITVVPVSEAERRDITTPLLEDRCADTRKLAEHLDTLREGTTRSPASTWASRPVTSGIRPAAVSDASPASFS